MITFSSINFETEISTFEGFTNFTDERLLPDREFARSEDHDSNWIESVRGHESLSPIISSHALAMEPSDCQLCAFRATVKAADG